MGQATLVTAKEKEGSLETDWEVNGFFKNETGLFTQRGAVIGSPRSTNDNRTHSAGSLLKEENALNLFINGRFSEESALHIQLNLIYDTQGANSDYRGHRSYSEHDYIRELYLDTAVDDIRLRLGKQQVVWGTADGIKLLDIINPTDYREFVQNTMEDSRIPVWMIKAEKNVGNDSNIQMLVAQRHSNRVPGLDADGDPGQPFMMKGVDSITGPVNGFRSIVPALGRVANSFSVGFGGNLTPFNTTTVGEYVGGAFGGSAAALNGAAQATNNNVTNLIDGTKWNTAKPNSTFEYMSNATFATFNAFVNASSEYRMEDPDELSPNLGLRFKSTLGSSFRYSLNYLYHYDPNPYVDMHWESATGVKLHPVTSVNGGDATVTLQDAAGQTYAAANANVASTPVLVFTQKMNRIHSVGGSFDTTVDTSFLGPVVLRGELLYQFDTKTPVVDRTKLGYGDLAGGLTNIEADQLKYVVGGDITVLTNLMISGQFIHFINLDFVEQAGNGTANSGRYTADPATMHLSNGLQKGSEYKEMFSLFLSKPFGEEQQGRVGNLTIYEEKGGWWNRLGVEWSFNDNWVGTAEWNQYWGSEDTMFGQFAKSSNAQVGLKYIF
ncbi:MAG: RNA polymerase-associated protein rapA [Magnetococcales bacterium]|nr:RNA polymerase-associated protein rapA [Magnetococcales bacterium]NGZ25435.1 RNA polymerase-associated protein rapA [Magnetococcales bacterium]